MVRHCCVPFCHNDTRKGENITFHALPKDENLRKQWLVKIRREVGPNFSAGGGTTVCSNHFTPSSFVIYQGQLRRRLKVGAIPTVFQWSVPKEPRRKVKRQDVPVKKMRPSPSEKRDIETAGPSNTDETTSNVEQGFEIPSKMVSSFVHRHIEFNSLTTKAILGVMNPWLQPNAIPPENLPHEENVSRKQKGRKLRRETSENGELPAEPDLSTECPKLKGTAVPSENPCLYPNKGAESYLRQRKTKMRRVAQYLKNSEENIHVFEPSEAQDTVTTWKRDAVPSQYLTTEPLVVSVNSVNARSEKLRRPRQMVRQRLKQPGLKRSREFRPGMSRTLFSCGVCYKVFNDVALFMEHRKSTYFCSHCEAAFHVFEELNQHVTQEHTDVLYMEITPDIPLIMNHEPCS